MTLAIYHVGSRGGGTPIEIPSQFKNDVRYVFFDADTSAAQAISDAENVQSHSIGLWDKDEVGLPFFITLNQTASSLLKPNILQEECISHVAGLDFDFSEATRIVEEKIVNVTSLDNFLASLSSEQSANLPKVDILSLDTQGSEYEILQGAKKSLDQDALCVLCEAEFTPLYKNQKLFGDICALLKESDLHFYRFLPVGVKNWRHDAPIGFRGLTADVWCDALFLRNPSCENLTDNDLIKLGFIGLLFGLVDYSFTALRQVKNPELFCDGENIYQKLMLLIIDLINEMELIYPPKFHSLIDYELSEDFSNCSDVNEFFKYLKINEYFGSLNKKQLIKKLFSKRKLIKKLEEYSIKNDTDLELTLKDYGFVSIAQEVKTNRMDQAAKVLKLLGVG